MKNLLTRIAVVLSFVLGSATALASPAESAKSSLMKAREKLLAMLEAEPAKYDALQAEIKQATQQVDEALATALKDKATTPAQATQYKEFKKTWEEFKKTRDGEIIPFIKAGKKDDAKALAKGVQAERMKKLGELLAALGAK